MNLQERELREEIAQIEQELTELQVALQEKFKELRKILR